MTTDGIRSLTTYICAANAATAIDFYVDAFGAVERSRMVMDDGRLGHAEISIGPTTLFLSDEWPEMRVLSPTTLGGNSCSFVLEVADVDAAVEKAVTAGAKIERPVADSQIGRGGWIVDPFGHRWNLMTSAVE